MTLTLTANRAAVVPVHGLEGVEVLQQPVEPEGKIHRVDPKFASWPSSLTENPYKSLRVDPDSGSAL